MKRPLDAIFNFDCLEKELLAFLKRLKSLKYDGGIVHRNQRVGVPVGLQQQDTAESYA